jgi:hypothetical protein
MINFRRDFPSWGGPLTDVYNSGAGIVQPYRNISVPTVFSYYLNNGQDLLTLQNNGSNVLRVTSDGNIYSSANGGFFSGGADLAENYTSTDKLEPGDVVMIDPNTPHGVLKTPGNFEGVTLGVVSTAPGFVAGAYTKNAYPIGLIGRVPVKVSTENGPIKIGDYLTVSSIPGYAMKATLAGHVIGKALENLNTDNLENCPVDNNGSERKCGKVMMFVNLVDYNGISIDKAIEDWAQGTSTQSSDILSFLTDTKEKRANIASPKSDIFADRVFAVSEMITPEMTTNLLNAKSIKGLDIVAENINTKSLSINSDSSSDNSYNMEVIDGKLVFRFKGSQDNVSTSTEQASSTNKIAEILTFDQSGNAIFAGQIKADKIVANNIVGLDIMAENFTRISNDVFAAIASSSQESSVKVLASTTEKHGIQISNIIASTTDIINKLTDLQASSTLLASIFTVSNDGLVIDKPVSLKNGLTVDKIGSNTEVLSLIGNVEFFGRPYFTTDTAGFAIIKSGSKKVNVVFEKEYLEQPIVNTTISINDSSTDADLDVDSVFRNDIRYVITNKSVHGFTIVLNKTNERDIQFSWIALAVRNAKTASSTQIDMQIAPNIQNNLPIINKVNSPVIELNNSSTTVQTNIGTTSVEQSIPANSNASTTSVDTNVNQSTVSTPSVENTNTPSTTTQSSTSETSKSTDTQTSTQTNAQEQGINTVAPSVPAQTNAETTNTPSATQSSPSETSQTSSSGSDSTSTGN